MDIAAVLAAVQFSANAIRALTRMAERARQDGEITEAQLAAVREAAKASDDAVDEVVNAAKARRP